MVAIRENLDSIIHYPDPAAQELRRMVSQQVGLPEEMIVAGNGAVEIIYLLMKHLKPIKALIPAPTFNEYEIAVRTSDGEVKDLLLDKKKGFAIDKEQIYCIMEDVDVLFICNPNNPTGNLTSREDIREITEAAGQLGKMVIVDEAFMDFVTDPGQYSVIDLIPRFDNLFVLYSMTKFHAIPGLRLGIGLGNPQLIEKINQIRDPWNVNCLAQIAGIASLQDEQYFKATVAYVAEEKEYLFNKIKAIEGLSPFPPSVNYIFIDVTETGYSASEIANILGSEGILIRDCSSYKNLGSTFIRVAVRKREENDRLVEALLLLGRKKSWK